MRARRPLGFTCLLGIWIVCFREQRLAEISHLVERAAECLTRFILSEELLRYEEHSDAEPVPFDVFVVSVARTDLQAVLGGIA